MRTRFVFSMLVVVISLFLALPAGAADVLTARSVHFSTLFHENPRTDVSAVDIGDGRTAIWVSTQDINSGVFLTEWTAFIGPDDLIVNKQATQATLRFRGVDLTWTATGLVTTITESTDVMKVTRPHVGTTVTKFTEKVLANDAWVRGVVDGRLIDNSTLPETATISRLLDRSSQRVR